MNKPVEFTPDAYGILMSTRTDTFLNVIPNALKGVRVLTLALNLPGPAAVMRLKAMGAQCTKLEPLAIQHEIKQIGTR